MPHRAGIAGRVAGLALVLSTALGAHSALAVSNVCINPGAPAPLEICIDVGGTPSAYLDVAGARREQYYSGSSWGSVIWLNGTDSTQVFSTGYGGYGSLPPLTPVSNQLSGAGTPADPYVITNITDVGTSGVRMVQRFTYVGGDQTVKKSWTLENTGNTTFSDLRFFHGGDTTFGGIDSARSWYDPTMKMVYVTNNTFTDTGYMGFYPNPATPPDHYHAGVYYIGNDDASQHAQLSDTADSSYQDAGYYLQWNRASLAPGDIWAIEAFETWSPPGVVQVLAPAEEYVTPGTTVHKTFKVQNLDETNSQSVTLSVVGAPAGWTTALPGGTTLPLAALEVKAVTVDVQVPAGANAGDVEEIYLTAAVGAISNTGLARLRVPATDYSFSSTHLDFGGTGTGQSGERELTFTNGATGSIKIGQLASSLAAPFTIVSDGCSGKTIAPNASCVVRVRFAPASVGAFADSFDVQVVAPALVTHKFSVEGVGAHNLTVSSGAGGSISPTSVTVVDGQQATLTITPDAGYKIETVTGCGGSLSGNSYTTGAITGDCAISATFAKAAVDVVVTGKGGGGAFDLMSLLIGALVLALRQISPRAIVAAVATAVMATTANATSKAEDVTAGGYYMGGTIGRGSSSESAADLTRNLQAAGYDVQASLDDSRMAWRVFGGWALNRYLAFEGGYTDLRDVKTRYVGTILEAEVQNLLDAAVADHPRSARGFDTTVVLRYPLAPRWSVSADVGAFFWNAKRVVDDGAGHFARKDDDGVGLRYGVSLEANAFRGWDVIASWNRFGLSSDHADLLGLGLRYRWSK